MTPAALRCAPDIHMTQVDDDLVVLDLANDRYEGLFDLARAVRLDGRGGLTATELGLGDELVALGLAVRDDVRPLQAPIVPATREIDPDPRPPRRDVWRALVVLSTATLRFRGKSLRDLTRYPHPLRDPDDVTEVRLAQLVGAARSARVWIPFEGECLQRAFLLRAFLASQGVAADWVFGVRTWPFAAHCWLQIDDLVVGDRLTRVSRFTPILRI